MGIDSSGINPMIAVKAGADMAQGMAIAERKATAYNALRSIYGDVVGPDDTAAQLSAMLIAQKKLPGELESQSLTNQTAKQNLDYNALANPERLIGLQQGNTAKRLDNEFDAANMPQRLELNRQAVTAGNQRIEQNKQTLRDNDNTYNDAITEKERNVAQGVIAGVKEAMEKGESPQAAFDRVLPQVAAMEGIDPSKLHALRQRFIDNPQATISAMEAHMNTVRPNTAMMRAQADQQRAATAQAKQDAKTKAAGGSNFIRESQENVQNIVGNILKDIPNVSTNVIARGLLGKVDAVGLGLNETETRYQRNLGSLRNMLGVEALAQRRASGLTFGQVTEKEFDKIAMSVAGLDNIRNPEDIKNEVTRIGGMYQRLLESDDYKAGQAKAAKNGPAVPALDPGEAARRKTLLDRYR